MFQNNTPLQKLNINTDKSTILHYTNKFGEKQSVQSHHLLTLHSSISTSVTKEMVA